MSEPGQQAGSPDAEPLIEEIGWPDTIEDWLRALAALPGLLFLDSASPDARLGRFSYLTAAPFATLRCRRGSLWMSRPDHRPQGIRATDPFNVLGQWLSRYRMRRVEALPPFQGGLAGLFSYDLCHYVERLPRPGYDEFRVPDLCVGLYDWVVALDHGQRRAWVVCTGLPETEPGRRRRRAAEALAQIVGRLRTAESAAIGHQLPEQLVRHRPRSLAPQFPLPGYAGLSSNFSRDDYLRAIERAIRYVYAGDIYQVNLSHRLLAPLREPPMGLYLRLRQRNPAPFAGYFDGGDFVIASASPERFLRVEAGEVETRPIKGTRPRWPTPEADMYARGELRESDKDRAENVMIVDLLRNDLGRVCQYGTVQVSRPLQLESYSYVHHLVSEVRGRLRDGLSPVDLLRAAFPGGSVTGAPKVRAMEIIAELEPTARGPYCGSLGFLGFNQTMDTNILIRSFTASRGWLQFPVGGGIVAQSSPEREYEETLHKAEGLLRALQ